MSNPQQAFSAVSRGSGRLAFDVNRVREDFPILKRPVRGKPLVYLDNAATTQKPQSVIDAISRFYRCENSNIHRGVHYLSQAATESFEVSRAKIQRFLNARDPREIVFVRGTTEAINLVAQSFGRQQLREGDEILISALEHHSNIVPWQILCEQTGARLRVIPMTWSGELQVEKLPELINERTRLISVIHISNALGTVIPVREIIRLAHEAGVPVLLDGAQSIPHMQIDVQELDCDFFAFSGHKLFGPTGVGILYGKADLLEKMPPYQGGGDMIRSVTFERTIYSSIPQKFEAGTPNISGAVGLGAAVDYLNQLGLDQVASYENQLLAHATERLAAIPEVKIIGQPAQKASAISFVVQGIHPHDMGTILDYEGIAVRTGHHCAQPVMDFFEIPATTRLSVAFYNTHQEIDLLAEGIGKVLNVFR